MTFPHAEWDMIGRACNPSVHYDNGGFYITFNHDFGDLPLLGTDVSAVEVYEVQRGTKLSLECGGSDMGVCNRITGKCERYKPYASSDGSVSSAGARGDCGYYSEFINPYY